MSSPGPARFLVLQHIGCEPAAAYGEELLARGLSVHAVRADAGEELPDRRDYAGILAMGGPMGAYDDDLHPWLAAEKRLIADAVGDGTPFWGVCLGAQLLAASLGARVRPGRAPEVGVLPVELTPAAAEDRVFALAPERFPAFHWHGDTYELPPGAVRLARSAQYEQQAFAVGDAYALQFHLEVDAALVSGWTDVPAYADSLRRLAPPVGAQELLAELERAQEPAIALARTLFGAWLERVVGV